LLAKGLIRFEEPSRLLEAVKADRERMALLLMGSDAGLPGFGPADRTCFGTRSVMGTFP
jgi:hypothetical protein